MRLPIWSIFLELKFQPGIVIPYPHRVVKENVTLIARKIGFGKPHEEDHRTTGKCLARPKRRRTMRGRAPASCSSTRIHQQPDGRAARGPYPESHATEFKVRRGSLRGRDRNRQNLPQMMA